MNHLVNICLIIGTWKIYDLWHNPLQTVLCFLHLSAFLYGINAFLFSLNVMSGLRLISASLSYAYFNYLLYFEDLPTALMYFSLLRYVMAVCLTSDYAVNYCRFLVSERIKAAENRRLYKDDEEPILFVLMDAFLSYFEYNLKGGPFHFCFIFLI